eukprot:179286-Chlamydomonas_euryale.AAC.3
MRHAREMRVGAARTANSHGITGIPRHRPSPSGGSQSTAQTSFEVPSLARSSIACILFSTRAVSCARRNPETIWGTPHSTTAQHTSLIVQFTARRSAAPYTRPGANRGALHDRGHDLLSEVCRQTQWRARTPRLTTIARCPAARARSVPSNPPDTLPLALVHGAPTHALTTHQEPADPA